MKNLSLFSKRLKQLRFKNKLKQKDLADELELSFNQISDWEIGRSKPDIQQLILLADFFKVSIDYLVGRKDWY